MVLQHYTSTVQLFQQYQQQMTTTQNEFGGKEKKSAQLPHWPLPALVRRTAGSEISCLTCRSQLLLLALAAPHMLGLENYASPHNQDICCLVYDYKILPIFSLFVCSL